MEEGKEFKQTEASTPVVNEPTSTTEVPVTDAPVTESPVSETTETPVEIPAAETPLEPKSINWDELFERDKDAYLSELTNQFGDKTAKRLNAVISSTQKKLDKLNRQTPETDNELFEIEDQKERLEAKIEALNGMVARLAPAQDATAKTATETENEIPVTEETPIVETPGNTIALSANVDNADRFEIPKAPVVKRPRTIKGMSALDPYNATELAARELGMKDGGIKLTKESFLRHTGYGKTEANKFKGLFASKDKGGMTLEAAGERLMEIDSEYNLGLLDQNDPNAGLNAILEVLSANSTMGQLRSYIARNRQEEAQREADAAYDAAYSAMMAEYEDMMLYEEVQQEELAENSYTEEEYNELMPILAEEINDYETRYIEGDSDTIYETEDIGDLPFAEGEAYGGIERSNQVLQETQPVHTARERDSQKRGADQEVFGENADSSVHNGEPSTYQRESSASESASTVEDDLPLSDAELANEIFQETLQSVPDGIREKISIRETSNGNEQGQNFVQSYNIDGADSGITRIDFFDAKPDSNPTWFIINGTSVDDGSDLYSKANAYRQSHPESSLNDTLEAGLGFRTFAEAYDFLQWSKQNPASHNPVAPTPVANPVREAQKKEKSLATQLMRYDLSPEQKQDMAFNAGKKVGDFFATREEYEAYAENATDLGNYNDDFERGVDESFANRGTSPDDDIRYRPGDTESDTTDDVEAEMEAIKEKAINDGTFMKAPNGKPTNLTERQWLQVRTKAFKKWFGDWENLFKKNFLIQSNPVATLTGNEFSKVEGKTLTDQVSEYFTKIGGKAVSPIYGDVILDRDGADDSLSHGMGRTKAIAYAAVKEVIENGILIDYDADHKGRGYDSALISAPITIGNEAYICSVVITRKEDNRFYLHEVVEQKWLSDEGSNTAQRQPQHPKAFANILQNIKDASNDVSKVVDENGEPLVVYHGSNAMFTVFDTSRIGSTTGTADGRGFYFTTDRDYARGFKTEDGQVFDVFLNIDNPLSYDRKTITKTQLKKILKEADRVEFENEGEHYMLSNYADYGRVGIDGAINEAANLEYGYADNDVELVGSLIGGSGSFDLIMDAVKKITGKSGMIAPKDNGTIHYVVTDPAAIKSATDNVGLFSAENSDIRYRPFGDNSGYVGYSMSKRAAQAREEGRFPKTDFKKEYGVTDKALDALVKAGLVNNTEWHHTSMYGNKTHFYGWDEGFYADIYAEQKKQIDKLAREGKVDEISKLFEEHPSTKIAQREHERDFDIRNARYAREKAEREAREKFIVPTERSRRKSIEEAIASDERVSGNWFNASNGVSIRMDIDNIRYPEGATRAEKNAMRDVARQELADLRSSIEQSIPLEYDEAAYNAAIEAAEQAYQQEMQRIGDEYKELDNELARRADIQNAAVNFLVGKPRLRAIENAVNEEAAKLGVTVTYKTRSEMPKGHENDKGYYNTKTSEIVVCTENASSINDAIQTILHEAVAHKGLRQLMGERFNEFINRVYDSLDAKTKAKVNALAEKSYKGDKMVAMEEYMATLAESTDFKKSTLWGKIKSIFEDIINTILGRNDIKIGDNELRYILRASYNNMVNPRGMESVRGWAQDQMMREEYKINEASPEILSRTGVDPKEVARTSAKEVYDNQVERTYQEIQRQFQDAMQPVRIAIEAI